MIDGGLSDVTNRAGHRVLSLVLGAVLLAVWLLAAPRISPGPTAHHAPVGVLATGGGAGVAPASARSDTRFAECRQKPVPGACDAVTGSWHIPVADAFVVTGGGLPAGTTGDTAILRFQGRAPPQR